LDDAEPRGDVEKKSIQNQEVQCCAIERLKLNLEIISH